MSNKDPFFKHLAKNIIKLNNYLINHYQNSQRIKEKILTCRTVDELENLCLSLDNSSENTETEWILLQLFQLKLLPEVVSDFYLSSLKLLVVNPIDFERLILKESTKLTHHYNRETGKVEPIDKLTDR